MNQQGGFQLHDLLPMARRRAPLAAAVATLVLLASIVLAAVLPNVYEASSTILVQPQSISEKLVEPGIRETELNRRLNLMASQILSRSRLSRVIDDLDLYRDESEEKTREEIIEMMRGKIRVTPVFPELTPIENRRQRELEIDTFRIAFRHESSRTAAAVANRLANDFIEEHIRERVRRSGDTTEFIEAELERLDARAREVEQQIARVQEENVGSLPGDLVTNQRMLERLLDDQRLRQVELAQAESDEAFYAQQEALASIGTGGSGDDGASPERNIELLQIKIAEYLAKGYTDKHPDVISARAQIEELEEQIERELAAAESADGEGEQEAPAGGRGLAALSAGAEKRRAALRAEAARGEIARIQAEIDQLEDRLARTPRVAEQLASLEREYEHLVQSTQDFSNRRLEASVSANMERRQKGEQFRVLESAFAPPDPVQPNRPLIVLLGAFLGGALGVGVAFAREAIDDSFHEARALQAAFRVPVLAAIPGILFEADRRARRRRRMWIGFGSAAVVFLVLSGAGAAYVYLNAPGLLEALTGEASEQAAPARPGTPSASARGPGQG